MYIGTNIATILHIKLSDAQNWSKIFFVKYIRHHWAIKYIIVINSSISYWQQLVTIRTEEYQYGIY